MLVPLAVKATVPVGLPVPLVLVTVAVNAIELPTTPGLEEGLSEVEVEVAVLYVNVNDHEVTVIGEP
jgi:hypothetical protein